MTVAGRHRTLPRSGRYPTTPWAARRLYRPFIRAAVAVALTVGFGTGVAMLLGRAAGADVGQWAFYAQAHGMTQIFGWTGLFVMGVASHVVPRFRGNAPIPFPWPQRVTLVCVLAAIAFRWAGQAWPAHPAGTTALLASGALLFGGVAIFAGTIGSVLRRGTRSRIPVERWLWAGLAWALAGSILHAWLCVDMAQSGASAAPIGVNEAFVLAGLFGFVGSFFFGVSLRAIPGFMSLRPVHAGLERAAFILFQIGLGVAVVSWLLSESSAVSAGMLVMTFGLAAFVLALRILEPGIRSRDPAPTTYGRYSWFLRAAFGWAVVALALYAADAGGTLLGERFRPLVAEAALHVFALGVITMAVFGLAARLLPLFEGRPLTRVRSMDIAFVVLSAGVAMRLVFAHPSSPLSNAGLAASGVASFIALVSFAWAIWPLVGREPTWAQDSAAWAARVATRPPR